MKTVPLIIALTGRPDVGKDTVADFLSPGHAFNRIAFADKLRSEVAEAWRIDQRMLTDRATKEWPLPALSVGMCSDTAFIRWMAAAEENLTEPRSARWVLQHWADFQRRLVPDYYAMVVARQLGRWIGLGRCRAVVTDLRFDVELNMLRSLGAHVVRVHRPDAAALPAETAQHNSEQHHMIPADYDLVNDGSLIQLGESVLELVARIEGREVVVKGGAA